MMENLQRVKRIKRFLLRGGPARLYTAYDFKDKSCSIKERKIEAIFPLAFTLHAFSYFPEELLTKSDLNKLNILVKFLEGEGKKELSYNYWIRRSKLNKEFPLPDDLDDTAFALSTLLKFNKGINEKFFLKIINLESKAGGPYRTWYLPKLPKYKKWQDIDPVVNANLVYLASLYGINLKRTERYLFDVLKKKSFSSPYYPYPIVFIFYLSRFAYQSKNKRFSDLLRKNLLDYNYRVLEPMEKLVYLISSAYLDIKIDKKRIYKFLELQKADGSFPALPFCHDFVSREGNRTYVGSEVITSALVLELLLVQEAIKSSKVVKASDFEIRVLDFSKRAEKVFLDEMRKAGFTKKDMELYVREGTYKALNALISTAFSLKDVLSKNYESQLLNLAVALLFAWSGYTVLDDVMDTQLNVSVIPKANTMIRKGWGYFYKLKGIKNLESELNDAFLSYDKAYTWELENARFDRKNPTLNLKDFSYNYIESRMKPFLISLRFIPEILGFPKQTGKGIYKIFKAKMIIDQLSDDAHDWEEDFKSGRMTYVLYKILKLYGRNVNIAADKHKLEKILWKGVMNGIIDISEREYLGAKSLIRNINAKNNYFDKVLEGCFRPIKKAKEEKKRIEKLVQSL